MSLPQSSRIILFKEGFYLWITGQDLKSSNQVQIKNRSVSILWDIKLLFAIPNGFVSEKEFPPWAFPCGFVQFL